MKSENKAESDQALAEFADDQPRFLFRYYSNLVREGFDPSQAMRLTVAMMMGMMEMAGRQGGE